MSSTRAALERQLRDLQRHARGLERSNSSLRIELDNLSRRTGYLYGALGLSSETALDDAIAHAGALRKTATRTPAR